MGKRTHYDHGTFSWVDLATTDPEGAKAFYGAVLGWEPEDMPAGEAGTYTMLRIDGDDVAGLYRQNEDQQPGVPPSWLSYVTVADAKEAVERVRALGGTVVSDAFEVTDVGRMAVIQDVTGATLGLWEPLRHIGATRVNDPGCLCWNDLVAEGLDAAERFYEPLFGWQVEPPEDAGGYRIVRNAGRSNGGLMPSPLLASVPAPSWLPYFNARDLDTATTSAQTGGGRVVVPPQDVPGGRMAVAQDPQGAVFGLFEGEVDD